MAEKSECIQVVVRCRPFNEKEKRENRTNIIDIDAKLRQVTIKAAPSGAAGGPSSPSPRQIAEAEKSFTFDAVYDENTQQRIFYDESCFSLVENVLEGFNATIFAYGQTGCGKSWTMQGPANPPELHGVIPNSFSHLFDYINATNDVEFLVRCSYLEIYNEEIKDLLGDHKIKNPPKCELKEDPQKGVFVKNLTDVVVETKADLQAMLDKGLTARTTAATLMNDNSSRSHSIFTIVVEMSTKNEKGEEHIRAGKLNLVDLAGSERQKKTGASGALLKEGAKINLSLSALGNVISALAENKHKHVPYRDSKLTRLLQDSLGGNTKTLMVAAISPADYNHEETMSTLRYANRAKNIQNKPKVNEDPKETLLREYKEEIERLKQMLAAQANGAADGTSNPTLMKMQSDIQKEAVRHFSEERRASIKNLVGNGSSNEEAEETSVEEAEEILNARLHTLQSKFVSHVTIDNVTIQTNGVQKGKQSEELEKATKQYKERKLEAKRKRDVKQKEMEIEMQRILDEKNDEMEELQKAASSGQSQYDKLEAKYNKMKKKYEKKVLNLEMELDDLRDEFYNNRQNLLDSVTSQEQDLKLYEQICRQLISEKEFNRILEKSKWDDNNEEWIIPFFKQTSKTPPSTDTLNNSGHRGLSASGGSKTALHESVLSSSVSGFLPGIHSNNNGTSLHHSKSSGEHSLPSLNESARQNSASTRNSNGTTKADKPKKKKKKKVYVSISLLQL